MRSKSIRGAEVIDQSGKVIGKVEENHLSEECLTDGRPDIEKIAPLLLVTNLRQYHSLGAFLGKAFNIGRQITWKS